MLGNYSFTSFDNNNLNVYTIDQTANLDHYEFSHIKTKEKLGGLTGIGNHGTHVAGIIVGRTCGVIKDPNIQFYNYAVCGEQHCDEDAVWTGLAVVKEHLKKSGRRGVINMSLGGYCGDECGQFDSYFKEIIAVGGVIVNAAGNSEDDACNYDPPQSRYVITVGNYNMTGGRSPHSNFGDCIDTWGPGTLIFSSFWEDYGWLSGTSMAAPSVTIYYTIYVSIFLIYTGTYTCFRLQD